MNSKIYEGKVIHTRLRPLRHGFSTRVGFVELDLAELKELDRNVRGFGLNRFAPVSIHEQRYLAPGPLPLREKLQPWIDALDLPSPPSRISWVTSPAWWGKVFNPVSFYLLRDQEDQPQGLIAEVNNTFGDRHIYPVRLGREEGIDQAGHDKEFHVSPFNDMEGRYQFTVRSTGDEIYIGVDLYKDGQKHLETWIEGQGVPLTSRSLWKQSLRHPLRPWLTLPRIVWQAFLLRYRHRLPVFKRPEPTHPHSLLSRHHPRV